MATPLTYAKFISALKAEGLKVIEVKTNGRSPEFHNRNHMGNWGPVNGVMIHHTGQYSSEAAMVELCRGGYTALPGPLCQGVIAKSGTVYVVGYGRCNHAGLGDDDVLTAVKNETALPADNEANTDGNAHFYGFECINRGDGKDPWPQAQLVAIRRAGAALCRAHGWSERSVIGHKEWQPGKVDPAFPMAEIRRVVGLQLKPPTTPPPPAPKPALTLESLEKRVAALEAKLK